MKHEQLRNIEKAVGLADGRYNYAVTVDMVDLKALLEQGKREHAAIDALRAYLSGEWDNPALRVIGELPAHPRQTMTHILDHYGLSETLMEKA